jgi:Tfp pilus assembly protein PilN
VIRTNLSTRPFYNVAGVRTWLVFAAAVVIAATAFNVMEVLRYSSSNTELGTRASADEARAADTRARAQKLRASVDPSQVDVVSLDARQANNLIDRRTFSWTELFNRFERTLPDDVRITSVRPTLDPQRHVLLTVNVLARSVGDVNKFMENLDGTGVFPEVRSREERSDDDGLIDSTLEMTYEPRPASPARAASTSAPPPTAAGGGR